MAIATEQIVTQYLADASGHMRAVSQIVTAQKGMTKSVEETTAATAKAGNSATEFLSKWKIGAGSISAVIGTLKSGFDELLKSQRLTFAAGSASISSLAAASGGLLERMDLLRIAAAGQTGAFKLTQQQMDNAAGAIRALTRDGNDQAKVMDKVLDAITKGTGGGLDDFGIIIDKTSSKVGDFNALMAALETQSNRVKGSALTQGESIAQLGVSFSDSMSKIKISIGQIVVALQPLIEGVASLTSTAAGWISNISEFGQFLGMFGSNTDEFFINRRTQFEAYQASGGRDTALQFGLGQALSDKRREDALAEAAPFIGTKFGDISAVPWALQFQAKNTISFEAKKPKRSGGGASAKAARERAEVDANNELAQRLIDRDIEDAEAQRRYTAAAEIEARTNAAQSASDAMNEQLDSAMQSLQAFQAEAAFLMSDAAESNNLEALFGPIEDFDAYANAFGMLTGAVGAAMSAWIDGTGNAGAAIKSFIADSLKAQSIEMAVLALKHGAYAIGHLAFGDVRGAALHAKSAAMFAGGAVAAGVGANLLGTSASASGGGGAQASAPSTISGTSGGSTGAIIVVGDSFSDDSPRMRQRKAEQLVNTAQRGGQGARNN